MPGKVICLDTYRRRRKTKFQQLPEIKGFAVRKQGGGQLTAGKLTGKKLTPEKFTAGEFATGETGVASTLVLRLLAAGMLLLLPAALIFQGMLATYGGH